MEGFDTEFPRATPPIAAPPLPPPPKDFSSALLVVYRPAPEAPPIGEDAKGDEAMRQEELKIGEYYTVTIQKTEDFDLYASL